MIENPHDWLDALAERLFVSAPSTGRCIVCGKSTKGKRCDVHRRERQNELSLRDRLRKRAA